MLKQQKVRCYSHNLNVYTFLMLFFFKFFFLTPRQIYNVLALYMLIHIRVNKHLRTNANKRFLPKHTAWSRVPPVSHDLEPQSAV